LLPPFALSPAACPEARVSGPNRAGTVAASIPDVEDAGSAPDAQSPGPHPGGSPTTGADEPSSAAAGDYASLPGGSKKRAKATSAKQVAANRANAKRSTGPRTKEGKERSRLNSLKHGLYLECTPYISHGLFAEDPKQLKASVKRFTQAVGCYRHLLLML